MRVLVTGATGLIGRAVVTEARRQGLDIVAVSRAPIDGVETIVADLLEPRAASKVVVKARASHMIHLAWADDPKGRWTSPQNVAWGVATLNLAQEFRDQGGSRAVFVGSCAEYDWSTPVLSEQTPLQPTTLYGATKAVTGRTLTQGLVAPGLGPVWARIFFCYGPGEPEGRLLGDVINGLRRGETVACTDGLQERDFLHTEDIARGLLSLLAADFTGPINLGSGIATPVRALITLLSDMIPTGQIQLGARPRPPHDPPVLVADTSLLKRVTGFVPKYDLKSGLADVLAQETGQ